MTLISHKYKLIFIHIPKTAGSYVKNVLMNIDPSIYEITHYKNMSTVKEYNMDGHLTYNQICEMENYEEFKDYLFFTFIRNPIELILSHYNYILTEKENHFKYKNIKDKKIEDVIDMLVDDSDYLRFIVDKNNIISENIEYLDSEFASKELYNLLVKCKIPEQSIKQNLSEIKLNESTKYLTNIDENIIYHHLYKNKYNLLKCSLFYLKIKNNKNIDYNQYLNLCEEEKEEHINKILILLKQKTI